MKAIATPIAIRQPTVTAGESRNAPASRSGRRRPRARHGESAAVPDGLAVRLARAARPGSVRPGSAAAIAGISAGRDPGTGHHRDPTRDPRHGPRPVTRAPSQAVAAAGEPVQVPDAVADEDEREDERERGIAQRHHRRARPAGHAAHAGHPATPAAGAVRPGTCRAWSRCARGAARSARRPGHGRRSPGRPRATRTGEPGGQQPEDDLPRGVRQGAEARRQHARHGDRHQQVRHVGVDDDRAAPPRPGRHQPGRAHRRDHEHEGGEYVQDPGGGHRARFPSAGGGPSAAAGAGRAPVAGRPVSQGEQRRAAGPDSGSVAPEARIPPNA